DHGIFLYDDTVHVPLIVRAPGFRPFRVGEVVRLTDVMPTALELLGMTPVPGDGISLVDLMTGRRHDLNLEGYSESFYPARLGWRPLIGLRRNQFKFIQAPRPELYDLETDPNEERNLYDVRRATADAMSARLAMIASTSGDARTMRDSSASSDLRARL